MRYRRRLNSDVWHWRTDCQWWPNGGPSGTDSYKETESDRLPASGEACNECLAKERRE